MNFSLFARLRSRRGFTLIELLIVIVIIGILAVGLVPKIVDGPKRARDTTRRNDLSEIQKALLAYSADRNGVYPATFVGGTCFMGFANGPAIDLQPYFQGNRVPSDPDANHTNANCGTAGKYSYAAFNINSASPNCAIIGTTLEVGKGGNSSAGVPNAQWCIDGAIDAGAAADKNYYYILQKD